MVQGPCEASSPPPFHLRLETDVRKGTVHGGMLDYVFLCTSSLRYIFVFWNISVPTLYVSPRLNPPYVFLPVFARTVVLWSHTDADADTDAAGSPQVQREAFQREEIRQDVLLRSNGHQGAGRVHLGESS